MESYLERQAQIFEAYVDRVATDARFRRRQRRKIFGWTVGVIVALALAGTVIGFANNWGRTAVEVISPANVKAQHEQVITKFEALRVAAGNACAVQQSAAKKGDSRTPTLVEDPTLAYTATFRNIAADYNSAVQNLFKAKVVMPPGYPQAVQLNQIDTTDWCTVTSQLDALR